MKLFIPAIITLGLSTAFVSGNDGKVSIVIESANAKTEAVVVKAPFKNHWDANTWEAGNNNFWQSPSESTDPKQPAILKLSESKVSDTKTSRG